MVIYFFLFSILYLVCAQCTHIKHRSHEQLISIDFYLNGDGDDSNCYCYNKLNRMTEAIERERIKKEFFPDCTKFDIVHATLHCCRKKKEIIIEMFVIGTNDHR